MVIIISVKDYVCRSLCGTEYTIGYPTLQQLGNEENGIHCVCVRERETDRADIKNSIQIMTLCTYNVLNEHFLYRSLKD